MFRVGDKVRLVGDLEPFELDFDIKWVRQATGVVIRVVRPDTKIINEAMDWHYTAIKAVTVFWTGSDGNTKASDHRPSTLALVKKRKYR